MANWFSPRRALPAMDNNDALNNGATRLRALATALDNDVSYDSGPLSSRPTSSVGTPGLAGRLYLVTDYSAPILFRDTGTGWVPITLISFAAHPSNSTGTISASQVFAKVAFATEDWDDCSWYDTTNSRFVPGVAGIYELTGRVELAQNLDDGNFMVLAVYKNGSVLSYIDHQTQASNYVAAVQGSLLVAANGSTDYFELWAFTSNAATRQYQGSGRSYFQGKLVRPA